ncbi:urea ABC transporter, permease protein UrtB [Solidesulfovibrio fructosivorans JJ]]|uniref:Urea ABC transporter, permease protein UrtB n=1 Tax=Solidesulfovibrio fructosivorans JJ] TaxID=596151 RepID=E1JTE3_SOLFR|nr:urea ABC transporter permease subunit UrtB [Solidesulfovibrio fructosivorans]EFL52403.1 urea ABC transporter, permease protein UrtB [Solidesulfovibrio fructosivorans JJ]]
MLRFFSQLTVVVVLLAAVAPAARGQGAKAPGLSGLCAGSRTELVAAVDRLGASGAPRDAAVLRALLDYRVGTDAEGRCVMLPGEEGGQAVDLASGLAVPGVDQVEPPLVNNRVRLAVKKAVAQINLADHDPAVRLAAAQELQSSPSESQLVSVEAALAKEKDSQVKAALRTIVAQINLGSPDPARKLRAIGIISDSGDTSLISNLRQLLAAKDDPGAADPRVRQAAKDALSSLQRKAVVVSRLGDLFFGVSLGSVLLLTSLGLAITFGLMGVINMAHGEMLMLGAYATYMVQQSFRAYFPGAVDYYLLAAIPFSFAVPFLVGMALERCIIRFLYKRPLETLLATWGISLGLIQTVRLLFGAQNVEVQNPSWLSGGLEVVSGLTLTYNRLAIIVFTAFVVFLCWFLLNRTTLGLQVRAVTQDRDTAKAMGIYTWKIDMWTFALGSGIAGLGGLALTQVGNVGPELGQGYIVDSFMVVVLGGVGKLIGTVVGALGLGVINKALEPFMGAVLGKIIVLALVIVFIQKRPQGLFAFKGRASD